MKFDLSIAFDDAEYLDPQIYMYIDTLKDNIPKDTILHVTTTRDENSDIIKYIKDNINSKIYKKPRYDNLISRCQYLLRAVEVDTDADWLVKTDLDILFLQKLNMFKRALENDIDVAIQMENRRIISDETVETRVWRNLYRAMNIPLPEIKLPYIENKEVGRPLLNTGVFGVKTEHLDTIKNSWSKLTKICERWIHMGIHPNEFAFTGIIFDNGWDFKLMNKRYNLNPISYYRKGEFPSVELIDNCKMPSDIILLHYHRPKWLMHMAKSNNKLGDIICRNDKYIPDSWWELESNQFVEK